MNKLISAFAIPLLLAAMPAYAGSDHGHGPKFPKFPPLFGSYQAEGLVLSASSTSGTASCAAAVGDTYSGVLLLSKGKTLTLRESVNLAAGASIYEQQFVGSGNWASSGSGAATTFTNSGAYNYGTVGQTSSAGTFTATLTAADQVSFVLKVTTTYAVGTAPNAGTCTETDQITLLGTSSFSF